MIGDPNATPEPWAVTAQGIQLDALGRWESIFALSNGHIGWRANLDEGEPHAVPGTLLNGLFESRPLPYAEPGYGYPESGESAINATDGKLIRLAVDDEPLDIRAGMLHDHELRLDLREGVLRRGLTWTSPAGRTIGVTSARLVSLEHRRLAAIHYEVEALEQPVTITLQSELLANEAMPGTHADPRVEDALAAPVAAVAHAVVGDGARLIHRTRRSELTVAAGMQHLVDAPSDTARSDTTAAADLARTTITCELHPGERLRLVKFVAYAWSGDRPAEALADEVDAALLVAHSQGWQGLLEAQREQLSRFWQVADIEIDGDPALQQAARFALFHVFQAGARAEGRAIPAKGLTGFGYNGHAFWDAETFVLPLYSYTVPPLAADALRWRHSTLPAAEGRARQLHLHGAAFPWRTIDGRECSGYWPAGTAAFHLNADIAAAVLRHGRATGDAGFEREVGLDLLAGTARLWMSLGHLGADGAFHIDGVTGPDEYSAIVDDNAYTNLMAAQNLRAAADAAARHPHRAAELGIDGNETAQWRAAADAMAVPFDERLGVHAQSRSFTEHERWDFEGTAADQYPLLQHFPYVELYRRQVVKQADLVLAMHLRHDAFTDEQKSRNFAYYEQLTVRDSSLSSAPQAILAAEVGQFELARDYLAELAGMDLDDLHRDTDRGVHLAALAGIWHVLVAGFGGMRHDDELRFRPRLPPGSTRLAFRLRVSDGILHVEIRGDEATYRWLGSGERDIMHYGAHTRVGDEPVTVPIPPARPVGPRPQQPPGRDPRRIVASR